MDKNWTHDPYPYESDEVAVLENKVKIVEKWVDKDEFKEAFYAFHESYGNALGDTHSWYS